MKVLVLIPAHNEEDNIKNVIQELKADFPIADILVVNDFSTDNTLQVLKTINNIVYLDLPVNLGYSGALQTGFKYAMKNNYDYVIQFDGDGQHIASEAYRLYKIMISKKVDIIIGSRFKEKGTYKHSFFRKIGTSLFNKIISYVCKVDITDPTSGFQILSKEVFTKYSLMNNYPEFPDANLLIEMLLNKYRIEEYHVDMRLRLYGESMHSGVVKPLKYMIKMLYAILLIIIFKRKFEHN